MQIDLKVVDKGLCGKGHSDAFVKLAAENGSTFKLMLDSKTQLSGFDIEEVFTVKIWQPQQQLPIEPEQEEP